MHLNVIQILKDVLESRMDMQKCMSVALGAIRLQMVHTACREPPRP